LALRCRTGPSKAGSILASRAKRPGIELIVFSAAVPDQPYIASVGYDHFVP
jgi:hypothetical protein